MSEKQKVKFSEISCKNIKCDNISGAKGKKLIYRLLLKNDLAVTGDNTVKTLTFPGTDRHDILPTDVTGPVSTITIAKTGYYQIEVHSELGGLGTGHKIIRSYSLWKGLGAEEYEEEIEYIREIAVGADSLYSGKTFDGSRFIKCIKDDTLLTKVLVGDSGAKSVNVVLYDLRIYQIE